MGATQSTRTAAADTPPRGSSYKPTFVVPYRQPRSAAEAQVLYNHVRTCALALDSLSRSIPLPFLQQLPPALDVGLESVIGFLLPVAGDAIGLVLGLYIVFCCWLFGDLALWTLGQMLLNVLIDAVIGIVPFIGDALDVAFKSNVRNLRLLESHLARRARHGGFAVDIAPSYEEEFGQRPPPQSSARARAPQGAAAAGLGGLDWTTVSQLVNLFSIGARQSR